MMKLGQRVYLQFDPSQWGTVSAVEEGRFRVTWHDPARKSHGKRTRYWYTTRALTMIKRGFPE